LKLETNPTVSGGGVAASSSKRKQKTKEILTKTVWRYIFHIFISCYNKEKS